jgi:structural maintenance of chromosomes protein 5
VRLRMRSFLTFEDTVMLPSPHLNLVVGPNGTGKSSIVSAVCVVFGGKLSLLGRSQELGAYVRHGAEEAEVEAWVYDPQAAGGVRRMARSFRREDGRSAYAIDGRGATLKDVEREKRRYDIQLDNLSQFMPQEKIADFVNMDPKGLLDCTVRALGGTDRLDLYRELISKDLAFVEEDGHVARLERALADHLARSRALESEVAAFNEHKAIKEEIRKIQRFLPWALHAEAAVEFGDLKGDVEVYKAKVAEKHAAVAALRGPLTLIEQRHAAAWRAFHEAEKRKVKDRDLATLALVEELENVSNDMHDLNAELETADRQADRHQRKIDDERAKLAADRDKLDEALRHGSDGEDRAVVEGVTAKRRAVRAELQETLARIGEAKTAEAEVGRRMHQLHARSSRLADARTHRLRTLEGSSGKHRGLSRVVDWVGANPALFRRKVHGPVAVEIDCENEFYARVMNAGIPPWILGAFVVECREDADTLRQQAKAVCDFRVTTVTPPTDSGGQWDVHDVQHPSRPVDDRMRALGIDSIVSDIFKAPDAVHAALNAQCNFLNTYVGSARADACFDQLVAAKLPLWYTPTSKYSCKGSRYDPSARSTSVDVLPPSPGIFGGRIDEVERERAQIQRSLVEEEQARAAARARREALEGEVRDAKKQDEALLGEANTAKSRTAARASLAQKVRAHESRIKTLQSGSTVASVERKKQQVTAKLAATQGKIVGLTQDLVRALAASLRSLGKMDAAMAAFSAVERELAEEERKHADTNTELDEMQATYAGLKDKVKAARSELRALRDRAQASMSKDDVDDFYLALGVDSAALVRKVEEKQELASRMTTGGGCVVVEYETLVKRVKQLQEDVAAHRDGQAQERARFEDAKREFMDWLDGRIQRMARRFSDLYKGFGCRGDIELVNKGAQRMSALQINILVSYRDGVGLMPISGQGNSGGEKMACTMLYCFALQEQEKTPPFVVRARASGGASCAALWLARPSD